MKHIQSSNKINSNLNLNLKTYTNTQNLYLRGPLDSLLRKMTKTQQVSVVLTKHICAQSHKNSHLKEIAGKLGTLKIKGNCLIFLQPNTKTFFGWLELR